MNYEVGSGGVGRIDLLHNFFMVESGALPFSRFLEGSRKKDKM
ncbi:hypothetical protein MTo_02490 [Microcystis aeruginosa NIES-1211]|jgi:hypothetical protein|uniref:Uncharacterized protein n=1 Tax=Microcystis aeruginosa NIES-2519 TaxID=2303981 RepID=A0A5A5R4F7_MICAE|nr:hypothetical protein MTo_02490 [Microcystis aeruginosa NIES-1211]GCA69585.1 hypothetical protein MiYa_01113 [Microcystis aeruginosa NIES-2519]GCA85764.1 hypothetical protein MiHa_03748 [Microcystis aeruginosa NIES-2522]GCA88425.1 hypothetical protein MiTa_01772 [Microcystis aeruginosa NIES-4264]CCI32813.1 hypothetical protein MICAI_2800002 [Microcystis sp. T1-4]